MKVTAAEIDHRCTNNPLDRVDKLTGCGHVNLTADRDQRPTLGCLVGGSRDGACVNLKDQRQWQAVRAGRAVGGVGGGVHSLS